MINDKEIKIASPGRINLIGEHIDYNDGFVLPAAIDKHIYLTFKANGDDSRCTIKSKGFDSVLVVDLNNLGKGTEGWHNYVLGVLSEIQKLTQGLRGFDCSMESNVPVGSGVSSSAALECGLAYGLNQLFKLGLERWDIIKLSQRAEHNYVGTKCGIMDQFASVMGKAGYTMIEPYRFLLLNTNVAHNLSTGEYNVRREQCEEGLHLLVNHYNVEKSFRNITLEMLQARKSQMGTVLFDRCSYVVEEKERVLKAVQSLRENKLDAFGDLMYSTHTGLSEKYEVSCPELDFLVEFSKKEPLVLGARMMGGGFGGCTLNLIHKDAIQSFVKKASKAYRSEFNIELSFFETILSDGVHSI
jgi:galactokinase